MATITVRYRCGCQASVRTRNLAQGKVARDAALHTDCPTCERSDTAAQASQQNRVAGLPEVSGSAASIARAEVARRRFLDEAGQALGKWRRCLDQFAEAGRPVEDGEAGYASAVARLEQVKRQTKATFWVRLSGKDPIDVLRDEVG